MKPAVLIGAAEVVLACVLGYNMAYLPQQRERERVQAQQADERTHQQTEDEVAAYLQQLERYHKRLPAEPDPAWLVRELVALADKSGVQVTTITPENPQAFEQFTRVGVSLQVKATYHQLGVFLDHIERGDRFIRVDRLEIPSYTTDAPTIRLVFSTLYVPPLHPAAGAQGR